MLTNPVDQARQNINHIRALIGLGQAVSAQTTNALSVEDIYRATIVLSVSALDHYVHEKSLAEMLAVHSGTRGLPSRYEQFQVDLAAARAALSTPASSAWLESAIRARNGQLTFQRPEKIADALRYATDLPLWPAVGSHLGSDAGTVKSRLDLIVNRRNQIAHEADCVPGGYGSRWPITAAMATDTVNFVSDVIEAIEIVV